MVFVIALNTELRTLFVWKCGATTEARGIIRRLVKVFGHCLHNITLTHSSRDNILHKQSDYNKVVNFTFESRPDWYRGFYNEMA